MSRDINIDCLKGFLIILVVIGHVLSSLNLEFVNYIYLFHMPAFIILSGMCYKKLDLKKCVIRTFVPFIVYMLLIYFYGKMFLYDTPYNSLIIGGKALGGLFGVFWFIPCLFYAKVIFGIINNLNIKDIHKFLTVIILYIINTLILKYVTYDYFIFWNVDIAFICLLYYSIGYFIESWRDNKYVIYISIILCLIISLLWYFNIVEITFNMKIKSLFYNPIIQIIFPLAITIVLLKILSLIKNANVIKKTLNYIGRSSLVIMYLHIVIFTTLVKYTDISYLFQIIISIIIPVFLYWLFNKNEYLKKLFIG